MELSRQVNASLEELGSLNDDQFQLILEKASSEFSDIFLKDKMPAGSCCLHGSTHSSLLILYAELAKRASTTEQLTIVLQELDWPQGRIAPVARLYKQLYPTVRRSLTCASALLPHLEGVEWALQRDVGGSSVVVLSLAVRTTGGRLQRVVLHCSLPHLVAVTDALRMACAAVNKLALDT